jgi:NIMA (never in mitosis gene a)-related kinase 1/4/5
VWSLGCVLYELCCLKHAFSAGNVLSVVHKIIEEKFAPISGQFSTQLADLVARLLEKDADRRPTMREVRGMEEISNYRGLRLSDFYVDEVLEYDIACPAL